MNYNHHCQNIFKNFQNLDNNFIIYQELKALSTIEQFNVVLGRKMKRIRSRMNDYSNNWTNICWNVPRKCSDINWYDHLRNHREWKDILNESNESLELEEQFDWKVYELGSWELNYEITRLRERNELLIPKTMFYNKQHPIYSSPKASVLLFTYVYHVPFQIVHITKKPKKKVKNKWWTSESNEKQSTNEKDIKSSS